MELLTLLLVVVVAVLVAVVLWEFRQRREPGELDALEQRLTQRVDALQQELSAHVRSLDERLSQRVDAVQQSVATSLASSSDTLRQTAERLTTIDSAAKRILEEVAPAVSSLQELLKAPGLRGGFGEFLLEQLLADALPPEHYATQHAFRNGERVDAIIRLPEGIVPIDSKFPLDAFQRLLACRTDDERRKEAKAFVQHVRGHIDAVARYIRPDEGTLPFALMYIPSEGV
jgi:DNA recombination protein RmuC